MYKQSLLTRTVPFGGCLSEFVSEVKLYKHDINPQGKQLIGIEINGILGQGGGALDPLRFSA